MKKRSALAWAFCMILCAGSVCAAGAAGMADVSPGSRQPASLVDISRLDRSAIEALKASVDAGLDGWWLEAGDRLVLAGSLDEAHRLLPAASIRDLGALAPGDLVLHAQGCAESGIAPSLILVDGLTYRLMRQTPHTRAASHQHFSHLGAPEWVDVTPNSVLARREISQGASTSAGTDPRVAALVRQVSAGRWFANVSTLAEFSRSSFNTTQLDAAREHIATQFASLGLAVSEPQFEFTSGTTVIARNVIGRWQGAITPDDWIVVGGHYDSRQSQLSNPNAAPGADDNASGCAGVMEAARVLVKGRPAEARATWQKVVDEEEPDARWIRPHLLMNDDLLARMYARAAEYPATVWADSAAHVARVTDAAPIGNPFVDGTSESGTASPAAGNGQAKACCQGGCACKPAGKSPKPGKKKARA